MLGVASVAVGRLLVVNATEPTGAQTAVPAAGAAAKAPAAVERAEALDTLSEARRLFGIAEMVQARRLVGGIESAVLAHRALTLLMRLVVRLHGDQPPTEFKELSASARAVASAESLLADDLGADLSVIDEMRTRLLHSDDKTSPGDDRRYDRAFVRSEEWLNAAHAYLDQRLPPPKSLVLRRLASGAAFAFVFLLGIAIGRHTGGGVAAKSAPFIAPNEAQHLPSRTPLNVPVTLALTNEHMSCEGCWPLEGLNDKPYAWTTGNVNLVVRGLTPGRRYRVTVGIADAGHVARVRFESSGNAIGEATFDQGLATAPEPMTAGNDGTLRWWLRMQPWRPKDYFPSSADGRELGVAIRDVRIEDAVANPRGDAG